MYAEELRWPAKAVAVLFGSILFFDLIVVVPFLLSSEAEDGFSVVLLLLGLTSAVLTLTLFIFGRLRAAIEADRVVVGFGPFKDSVPFSDIRSVAAVRYRFREFGGWGIRVGRRAKLYNVPGDRFRAVEITKKNDRRLLFSSRDPEAFALAIEERLPARPESLPA